MELKVSTKIQIVSNSEPCPYCHEDKDGYVTPLEKNAHLYVAKDCSSGAPVIRINYRGYKKDTVINFCPMCGRDLRYDRKE